MTLPTNDSRKTFTGNGFTTAFKGPKVFAASHLQVYVSGLLVTTGFVVTNLSLDSSLVTFTVAPGSSIPLVILRRVPYTQNTQFKNQGAFFPENHENAIDYQAMMSQQLDDRMLTQEARSGTGDMTLRSDMALAATGKGTDLLIASDVLTVKYLKTTSDIINGLPVSLHRFIDPTKLSAIRANTSTYDAGPDIVDALAAIALKTLYVPNGRHNYSGNLTRAAGYGLAIRGESTRHSVLRCIGAGGIIFDGGTVVDFNFPTLDLESIRFLAAIPDAGTAVTLTYVLGSGSAGHGPRWSNVAIESEIVNTGFNKGIRGTNVRDFRIEGLTLASAPRVSGWPGNFIMTNGMEMDGNDDPVELWISNLYSYYNNLPVKVGGQYEGLYIDHMHTVAVKDCINWASATPNPVAMIQDSYLTAERDCITLDQISYFRIQNNVINPTAPVPYVNFRGINIRRTVGNQTQASSISNNTFIGVGYRRAAGAYSETGVYLENANTVEVTDNTVYDMDMGVQGIAGSGNRVVRNRYISCVTKESMPASMRYGEISPECVFKASRVAALQTININTVTTVLFESVERDDRAYYTAATGVFLPAAGHYRVRARIRMNDLVVGDFLTVYIVVAGVAKEQSGMQVAVAGQNVWEINGLIEVTGAQAITIAVNIQTGVGGATRNIFNQDIGTRFEAEAVGS